MPVVERVARIRYETTLGGVREFTATAERLNTPAGDTVSVLFRQQVSGDIGAASAGNAEVALYVDDTNTLVRSVSVPIGGESAGAGTTVVFHLTNTGAAGGAARAGTLRIRIRVWFDDPQGLQSYDANSDTGGTGPTTLGAPKVVDRGWIRGTTTATLELTNGNYGDPEPSGGVFTYGDTIKARLVPAHVLYAVKEVLFGFGPVNAQSAAGAGTIDSAVLGAVNNRFPVARSTYTPTASYLNANLTGSPFTVLTALTTDSDDIDPRLTYDVLFQINDNVWGFPPLSKDELLPNRLTADLGFVAKRIMNARGEGVNGITWSRVFRDKGQLIGDVAAGTTTTSQNQGGEPGWASAFFVWRDVLPSGEWEHITTVTAPAGAVGLDQGRTATYVLLAADPSIVLVVSGGPTNRARHFKPGMAFQAGVSAVNVSERRRVPLDPGSARAAFMRLADASLGAQAGFAQYLEADGVTWTSITTNDPVLVLHPLVETRPGSNVWTITFTAEQTATWGEFDVFIVGQGTIGSVPYSIYDKEISVGIHAPHDTPVIKRLP